VGCNVNGNAFTLKEILLAMRGFDKLLRSIQSNILKFSAQNPSAGLFSPDAPLTLLDAIGRELPVHFYLTSSFEVSNCIFHSFFFFGISKTERGA
jgi:hypothetical protein